MRQDEADTSQDDGLIAVPTYLSQSPHCPACYYNLHYSSEWGIRICELCGYIEGDREYILYPRPFPLREYLWFIGYAYTALRLREIDRDTYHDMVGADGDMRIAIRGSMYRPSGEK